VKIGLALSGGGVGGAAHIGVLRALEEQNIRPDIISGSSMGTVVAALYAAGFKPDEIKDRILSVDLSEIKDDPVIRLLYDKRSFGLYVAAALRIRSSGSGMIDPKGMESRFAEILRQKGVVRLSDCGIPVALTAVDIDTAQAVVFVSDAGGMIHGADIAVIDDAGAAEAVRASVSYPVIFRPGRYRGRRLLDGGIYYPVPARVLNMMGADRILAVDAGPVSPKRVGDNIVDITSRAITLMGKQARAADTSRADLLISIPTDGIGLFEFDKLEYAQELGYVSAVKMLPEILDRLYF